MLVKKHFPHTRAYLDYLRKHTPPNTHAHGHNITRLLDADASKGSPNLVPQARALLNNFQEQIDTITTQWTLETAGGFPCIGAFLAGDPEHMWQQEETRVDSAPMRIFVSQSSWAGVPAQTLLTRGIAVASLAMALSEQRTVYITPYKVLGDYTNYSLYSYDLATSPLILSELMAHVATPEVSRNLGLYANDVLAQEATGHTFGYSPPSWYKSPELREHLNAGPDDLIINRVDTADEVSTNPIAWVKRQLAIQQHLDPTRI